MTAKIKPIRSYADHRKALKEINRLWGSKPRTADGDRLEVLAILVEAYEREHFPIASPDPIEAIKFRLEQMGLDRKALKPAIGTRARVNEILSRKRGLTLSMIRRLSETLDIPADVLIRPTVKRARNTRI